MAHTKGKLHCHDEAIHLMYSENDKVIDHTCIALINEFLSKKEIDYWAKHICHCVNSHDALLEACKKAEKAFINRDEDEMQNAMCLCVEAISQANKP